MAYITKYTYHLITTDFTVDKRITAADFVQYIYNSVPLYRMFNSLDLKKIVLNLYLVDSNNGLFKNLSVLKQTFERADNHKYIFSVKGKPKYHKNENCPNLRRGFKNFNTPRDFFNLYKPELERLEKSNIQDKDIQIYALLEKRAKAFSELRSWFLQNNFTPQAVAEGKVSLQTIIMRYNSYFPKKYEVAMLNDEYPLLENIENKGIEEIENKFDISDFQAKVEAILFECHELINLNELGLLRKYDFLCVKEDNEIINELKKYCKGKIDLDKFMKSYKIEYLKNFLLRHYQLKLEIIEELVNFMKWKYNFTGTEFENSFLENLNLEPCKICFTNNDN